MSKSLVALVGMKHRRAEALVASLPAGEPLVLSREIGNPHDPNAVQVWARGQHIGYLKMSQNRGLAVAMDSAIARGYANNFAGILRVDGGRWPMVETEL